MSEQDWMACVCGALSRRSIYADRCASCGQRTTQATSEQVLVHGAAARVTDAAALHGHRSADRRQP
jgi:hypothetical protein